MDRDWIGERNQIAAASTRAATFLIGKTIASVAVVPHDDEADCVNVLRLAFTDGTGADVEGSYGGYTGHSCDEYMETIGVTERRQAP